MNDLQCYIMNYAKYRKGAMDDVAIRFAAWSEPRWHENTSYSELWTDYINRDRLNGESS